MRAKDMFKGLEIPPGPIKIAQAETITDVGKFIDSHCNYIDANKNNPAFNRYKERLRIVYNLTLEYNENKNATNQP